MRVKKDFFNQLRRELTQVENIGINENKEKQECETNDDLLKRIKDLELREEELLKQIKTLQDSQKLKDEGVERLPIVAFLDYVETYFTSEQNDRAKVVKEVLGDLYSNISEEEKKRLRALGTKEKLTAKSMFEITGNDQVHIGGK